MQLLARSGAGGDKDVTNRLKLTACGIALMLAVSLAHGQTAPRKPAVGQNAAGKLGARLAFTVSMDQPATHIYHVVFRCEGLTGPTHDFKMPVWSPGYYAVLDFPKNVRNFSAADGAGRPLAWEKVTPNDWRVETGKASVVVVTYDVLAPTSFVANPYLGAERGLIIGTGVFMQVPGLISQPVTVEIAPYAGWHTVATGLDAVPGKAHTFKAANFDVLYDSPILIGNLESLPSFTINGVPHRFIGHNLGTNFDRDRFVRDLKAVVEQGVAVIGEVPYTNYTFLGIGDGRGGIEHLNSAAVPFTGGPSLETRDGRIRTLNFLAHEYFHSYNVKRIRPIALGPFDYDGPNLTNMLWVPEGFTVYYEYLMVARAGLMNQDELLDALHKDIAAYESSTGHLFQSATQSSYGSWTQGPFGGRGRGGVSKTISYYNKGSVLGLLLDLKIRHETRNQKSLDTVMQTLYRRFYRQLGRGWTDGEFRGVCEAAAGVPLDEIFDYAATTRDIDYDKYLGYAGLQLEKPVDLPDAYLGAVSEDVDGRLVVAAVEPGSPAALAHVTPGDRIKAVDGAEVDARSLATAVAARKPGDRMTLALVRAGNDVQVDVALAHKVQRSFKIEPVANPHALQSAILADLIKPRQVPRTN